MLNRRLLLALLGCGALLTASGLLQLLVDSDLGVGWPHNVIRNWSQFGLGELQGHLVINPGGQEALAQPDVYSGHRAASLYPAFWISRLFAWTGSYMLPFHLLLNMVVMVSIWKLLGQTSEGFFIGALLILCPGYVLWPTILDPNAMAALAGIPFAALVWRRLRQEHLSAGDLFFLVVLTLLFSALNWTVALVHAPLFFCLLATRKVSWQRLALYAGAGALAGVAVVVVGLTSKLSDAGNHSGGFGQLLAGYTWGSGGYANGSNTPTLLLRLAFINIVALLPLWLVWAWKWSSLVRSEPVRAAWSLLPLGVAVLEPVAMRNYFCHHPWMAAPFLLVGGILSLFVILSPAATPAAMPSAAASPRRKLAWSLAVVTTFCFGFVILLTYREQGAQLNSLIALVRAHTPRSEILAVPRSVDPQTAAEVKRLDELLDRRLIVVDRVPDPQHPAPAGFVLSGVALEGAWSPIARSTPDPLQSVPLLRGALNWFNQRVSRRKSGDRLDLPETFFLYQVPTAMTSASSPAFHEP